MTDQKLEMSPCADCPIAPRDPRRRKTVTRAGRKLKKLLADKKVSSATVKYRDDKMRLVFDPSAFVRTGSSRI